MKFHTHLLGCLRYREKHVKDVCCCLHTCNSDVYVVVMGLLLGQSLMVISTTGIMLHAKVSPLYNVQVNEKSCRFRMGAYRDGVKRKRDKIGMGL